MLDSTSITPLIEPIFQIRDITSGEEKDGYLLRYRGQLTAADSAAAYDDLAAALAPQGLMPLFRKDAPEGHMIYILRAQPPAKNRSLTTNLLMFLLTVVSVMLSGAQIPAGTAIPADPLGQMTLMAQYIFTGWPFALALLSILLAHEFGHYLAGRWHKTDVSLPFFIPLPFSLLGTMGAFINMREMPKNRRDLLDIGIAGPLAGFVVAVPVLFIGLTLSSLGPVAAAPDGGFLEGNSLFYLLAKYLVFGKLLPAPAALTGGALLWHWVQFFFTGAPLPIGGEDVFIHAVALAGWAGLLVTSLNLIPAGQLDGGHILYALFGEKIRYAFPVILIALAILGFFWSGWWLWLGILFLFGRTHPELRDEITELDPRRRLLVWLAILLFLLVFAPVPMVSL